jgi:hypothetical protein
VVVENDFSRQNLKINKAGRRQNRILKSPQKIPHLNYSEVKKGGIREA